MTNALILYNPFSQNGAGEAKAKALAEKISSRECIDMTKIESYADFFASHPDEDIILCGGDGTLNRFINDTAKLELKILHILIWGFYLVKDLTATGVCAKIKLCKSDLVSDLYSDLAP